MISKVVGSDHNLSENQKIENVQYFFIGINLQITHLRLLETPLANWTSSLTRHLSTDKAPILQ